MHDLVNLAFRVVTKLPPEMAHNIAMTGLRLGIGLPDVRPDCWSVPIRLPKSGLALCNPVGLAAGFDKNGTLHDALARFGFGFVECGTITPQPQAGNPKPRLFRLDEDQGVINRMGFNNCGLDHCIQSLRTRRLNGLCPIGVNIGPNKTSADPIADYETGIARIYAHASYITLNISSPNTPGLRQLHDKVALADLLQRCEIAHGAFDGLSGPSGGKTRPVFVKIAPDLGVEALDDIVTIIHDHGSWLSGLIVSNTTIERPESLQSIHKTRSGGLSGRPLMAKSTALLKYIAGELDGAFDLIGCGGVASGADAYTKIRAGAHAVQVYSALIFHGPRLVTRINQELAACLRQDGFSCVADAVGADL